MKRSVYHFLRNTKVFSRLLLAFLIIATVPMAVVAMSAYSYYSNLSNENIGSYVDSLLNQSAKHIKSELSRLESDAVNLMSVPVVQSFVTSYPYLSHLERYQGRKEITDLVADRLSLLHHISDVVFITNDYRHVIPVYGGTGQRFDTRTVDMQELATQAAALNGKTMYSSIYEYARSSPGHFISRGDVIYDRCGILLVKQFHHSDSRIIAGYLVIRVDESFFSRLYQDIEIGEGATVNLIDRNGVVLSSTDKQAIGKLFVDANGNKVTEQAHIQIKDQDMMYLYYPVQISDLTAVAVIPQGFIRNDAIEIASVISKIVMICIVISLLLTLFITQSISRPLNQLTNKMQLVREGDFAPLPDDQHRDELATVRNIFNHMLRTIDRLIGEIKDGEREKAALQIKALTAQINPHFINNTLGSIKLVASMQNATSIESMVASLSNILSAIMGKGEDCIPIRQELALLEDYMNLQQYRSFDAIDYYTDIDERILDSPIPRFTLQPVVENCIVHGFSGIRQIGEIRVEGKVLNNNVLLSITDNGCGIPSERITKLLHEETDRDKQNRIGIYNVDRRIRLLFGEQYGLQIDSDEGVYTRVEIRLPLKGEGS